MPEYRDLNRERVLNLLRGWRRPWTTTDLVMSTEIPRPEVEAVLDALLAEDLVVRIGSEVHLLKEAQ